MPALSTFLDRRRGRASRMRGALSPNFWAPIRAKSCLPPAEPNRTTAALWGVFRSGYRPGNHIITTRIEHPAILATCKALENAGAEVTIVPVNASGRVDPAAIAEAMRESTILISVMHANNETGVIQPIEEISRIGAEQRGILLHTDAVQSVGKIPVNVRDLESTCSRFQAIKFMGRKAWAFCIFAKGTKFAPFMTGGAHERKRRAGTENVPAIAGLGAAARLAARTAVRNAIASRRASRPAGDLALSQIPRGTD